ncbi:hypothetical protein [Saccharopolyspora taberi]
MRTDDRSEHDMDHAARTREPARRRAARGRMSAAEKRRRAADQLAHHADNAAELSEWLEMLGLSDQRR